MTIKKIKNNPTNRFLTKLPFKLGIGVNNSKKVIDWSATVGMNLLITYNNKNYTLHINSYTSQTETLNITFCDISETYNLYISTVRNLKFSKILKPVRSVENYYYAYSINDIIKSNNRNLIILEKTLISNNYRNIKSYEYLCINCNTKGVITEKALNKGCGCSVCSHKKTVTGINDINTTHPNLNIYFCDKTIPFNYSYSTRKAFDVRCPDCGYIKHMRPRTIGTSGFACPKCGDGKSYPEKFTMALLDQLNVKYEVGYYPDWIKYEKFGKKFYDIYLNEYHTIVEINGPQHSIKEFKRSSSTKRSRTLDEEIKNDLLKKKLAYENGINNYIYIDARESELEYLKNIIQNSELSKLFSLENIDWLKCSELATKSLVKDACSLWNEGIGITDIKLKLHLSRKTVRLYLKRGSQFGWCDYNPENSMEESKRRTPRTFLNKAVVCLETGIVFNSIKDAGAATGSNTTNIGNCCKNKRRSSGGFHWMFLNDYKKHTDEEIRSITHQDPFVINLDTLETFNSIKDAQKHYNSKGNITLCCQGKYSTACGYRWMYFDDYTKLSEEEKLNLKRQ